MTADDLTLSAIIAGWVVTLCALTTAIAHDLIQRHTPTPGGSIDDFRRNVETAIQTTLLPIHPELEPAPDTAPLVPGFAERITVPDDPTELLPPLTAGHGHGYGNHHYTGPVPVQRVHACSFCLDGELVFARAQCCPWCGE